MSEFQHGFQVRRFKPWKLWLVVVLSGLILWFFFILGQADQSDQLSSSKLKNMALMSQVDELESRNHRLVIKNAQLSTTSLIEHDAYVIANQSLIELQKKLLEQKEELVFYQGIVSPKDVELGINLQTFEVKRTGKNGVFNYRMVLTKRGKGAKKVTGSTKILIQGEDQNVRKEYLLSEIDFEKSELETEFSFRYFQVFEGAFSLVDGFMPYDLKVEVVSTTKKVKSFTENILWARALTEDS